MNAERPSRRVVDLAPPRPPRRPPSPTLTRCAACGVLGVDVYLTERGLRCVLDLGTL